MYFQEATIFEPSTVYSSLSSEWKLHPDEAPYPGCLRSHQSTLGEASGTKTTWSFSSWSERLLFLPWLQGASPNVGLSVSISKILSNMSIFGNTSLHPELRLIQKDNRKLHLRLDHSTWSPSTEWLTKSKPTNKNGEVPYYISILHIYCHIFIFILDLYFIKLYYLTLFLVMSVQILI